IAAAEILWDSGFPRVLCYSYPHMRGSEVRSLLSPDHHEPLCSCSPPCLSVFLGGITPVSFRAEDKGNCPQSGGFGQSKSTCGGYARSTKFGRAHDRGPVTTGS